MAFQLTGNVVLVPPSNLGQIRSQISGALRGFSSASGGIADANKQLENFGRQAGLAARRFVAFSAAAGTLYRFTRAMQSGFREAISFERQLVRIAQLGDSTRTQISAISDEVGRLSTALGVSSAELVQAARTFRQAGFDIDSVKESLDAVAQAALAPNFGSIEDTVEGAIAAMRQFNIEASELQRTLGGINAVASSFAVDAADITQAIQRAGGAFSTAGGNLFELVALFTSVRDTTRESASSIATGLRTIFTRLQRESTVDALEQLGINLRRTRAEAEALGNSNLENQFVGAYEAIRRISVGLQNIPRTDPQFARIVEQIGGFRQVSRVIPLIERFGTAQSALSTAQQGSSSLQTSTARAAESLEVRLSRLNEKFLKLARDVVSSPAFQTLAKTFIQVGEALAFVADKVQPLIPLLGAFLTFRLARGIGNVVGGFATEFFKGPNLGRSRPPGFARGGLIPGTGGVDDTPIMATRGEFIFNKEATRNIGPRNLEALQANAQRANRGALIQKAAKLGIIPVTFSQVRTTPVSPTATQDFDELSRTNPQQLNNILNAAGVIPNSDIEFFGSIDNAIKFKNENKGLNARRKVGDYTHNQEFYIKPNLQKSGSATESYTRQILFGGGRSIKLLGARSDEGRANDATGYYVWPSKFGADTVLPNSLQRHLSSIVAPPQVEAILEKPNLRLQELLAVPGGDAFWKQYGEAVNLEINPNNPIVLQKLDERLNSLGQRRRTFNRGGFLKLSDGGSLRDLYPPLDNETLQNLLIGKVKRSSLTSEQFIRLTETPFSSAQITAGQKNTRLADKLFSTLNIPFLPSRFTPGIFEGTDYNRERGHFSTANKAIILSNQDNFPEYSYEGRIILSTGQQVRSTLAHELGHAIDYSSLRSDTPFSERGSIIKDVADFARENYINRSVEQSNIDIETARYLKSPTESFARGFTYLLKQKFPKVFGGTFHDIGTGFNRALLDVSLRKERNLDFISGIEQANQIDDEFAKLGDPLFKELGRLSRGRRPITQFPKSEKSQLYLPRAGYIPNVLNEVINNPQRFANFHIGGSIARNRGGFLKLNYGDSVRRLLSDDEIANFDFIRNHPTIRAMSERLRSASLNITKSRVNLPPLNDRDMAALLGIGAPTSDALEQANLTKPLTPEELVAVRKHSFKFDKINRYLRTGNVPGFLQRQASLLDSAISKTAAPRGNLLFRGFDKSRFNLNDPGFLSFSSDAGKAFRFATGAASRTQNPNPLLLALGVPTGLPGIGTGAAGISAFGNAERETLLPRNLRLREIDRFQTNVEDNFSFKPIEVASVLPQGIRNTSRRRGQIREYFELQEMINRRSMSNVEEGIGYKQDRVLNSLQDEFDRLRKNFDFGRFSGGGSVRERMIRGSTLLKNTPGSFKPNSFIEANQGRFINQRARDLRSQNINIYDLLERYTGAAYSGINNRLRNDPQLTTLDDDSKLEFIAGTNALTKYLNKPLRGHSSLFRGVRLGRGGIENNFISRAIGNPLNSIDAIGSIFQDPAFLSTSLDRNIAEEFAFGKNRDKSGLLIQIDDRGFTKGQDISRFSDYRESEILLQRNSPLRIENFDSKTRTLFTSIVSRQAFNRGGYLHANRGASLNKKDISSIFKEFYNVTKINPTKFINTVALGNFSEAQVFEDFKNKKRLSINNQQLDDFDSIKSLALRQIARGIIPGYEPNSKIITDGGDSELFLNDNSIGYLSLGPNSLIERHAARNMFPKQVNENNSVGRIFESYVDEDFRGRGFGQRLYLEGLANSGLDFIYNSQAELPAQRALTALDKKGLINSHFRSDGGKHIANITESGKSILKLARGFNKGGYLHANRGLSITSPYIPKSASRTFVHPIQKERIAAPTVRGQRPFQDDILPLIENSPFAAQILSQLAGTHLIGEGSEAGVFRVNDSTVRRVGDLSTFPRALDKVLRGEIALQLNKQNISPQRAAHLRHNLLFRPNIPEMLQAIPGTTQRFGNFIVEDVPYATPLRNSGLSYDEQEAISAMLAQRISGRGLDPFDVAPRNIGLVGGNPFIIDPGAIAKRNTGGTISALIKANTLEQQLDALLRRVPTDTKNFVLDEINQGKLLGRGTEGVAVRRKQGDVLRIGDTSLLEYYSGRNIPFRPNIPEVLQANSQEFYGNTAIELLPFGENLSTLSPIADLQIPHELAKSISRRGFDPFDVVARNIKVFDGQPLVVDPGAIARRNLNSGGFVPGVGNRDTHFTTLPEGSFVLRKEVSQKLNRGGQVPVALTPGERVFSPREVNQIGVARLRLANQTGDTSFLGLNKGGSVQRLQNGGRPIADVEIPSSQNPSRELNRLILMLNQFAFAITNATTSAQKLNQSFSQTTYQFENKIQELKRLNKPTPPKTELPERFRFEDEPPDSLKDSSRVTSFGSRDIVAGRFAKSYGASRAAVEQLDLTSPEGKQRLREIEKEAQKYIIADFEKRGIRKNQQVAAVFGGFTNRQTGERESRIYQRASASPEVLPAGQRFVNSRKAQRREQIRIIAEQRGISTEGGDRQTLRRLQASFGGPGSFERFISNDTQSQELTRQRQEEIAYQQIVQNQRLRTPKQLAQARRQANIQVQAFYEGQTAGIADAQGNFVGLGGLGRAVRPPRRTFFDRLFNRPPRQVVPPDVAQQRRDLFQQRAQTAILGASTLASYITPLIRGTLTANDAVKEGIEGRFTTQVAASGALTGATTLASAGAAFGPWGAAIGGAIGAVTGLADGLKEAANQISQANIGKAVAELGNTLNLQNERLRLRQNVSQASINFQNAAVDANLERISNESTRIAQRNLSVFGIIPTYSQQSLNAERNRIFNENVGSQVGSLQENLLLQARNIGRENPNLSVDDIINRLVDSGTNRVRINTIARSQNLDSDTFTQTQLRQQIVNQEFDRQLQENNNALRELTLEFSAVNNNIQALTQTILDNTNAVLNIGNAFRGNVQQVNRPLLSNEILGTSRFDEIVNSTLPDNGVAFVRNNRELLRAGNAISQSGNIIDELRRNSGGNVTPNNIREALNAQLQSNNIDTNNAAVRQLVDNVSNQLTGEGTSAEINDAINSGNTNLALRQILDSNTSFRAAYEEVNRLQSSTQNLINGFDSLYQALASVSSELIQLDFSRAELALQQRQTEVSFETPVRSVQLERISLEEAQQPIITRRQNLIRQANLQGAGLNVNASVNDITSLYNQIEARLAALSVSRDSNLNASAAGRLEDEFNRLVEQGRTLRQVLQDYTNVQQNTAAAQERLNALREEEANRFRVAETLLTADSQTIARSRFGLGQALAADRSGVNIAELSRFQRTRIFEALQLFSGTQVNDNGRNVNVDQLRRRLLERTGLGLNAEQRNQAQTLQTSIIQAFRDGQAAYTEGLIRTEENQLSRLTQTLQNINNNFLSQLSILLTNNSQLALRQDLTAREQELARSVTRRNDLQLFNRNTPGSYFIRRAFDGNIQRFAQIEGIDEALTPFVNSLNSIDRRRELARNINGDAVYQSFANAGLDFNSIRANAFVRQAFTNTSFRSFTDIVQPGQRAIVAASNGAITQEDLDLLENNRDITNALLENDPEARAARNRLNTLSTQPQGPEVRRRTGEAIADLTAELVGGVREELAIRQFRERMASAGASQDEINGSIRALRSLQPEQRSQVLGLRPAAQRLNNAGISNLNQIPEAIQNLDGRINELREAIQDLRRTINNSNVGLLPIQQQNAVNTIQTGGVPLPFAVGGVIPNLGNTGVRVGTDTVPALLTPGEFVVNAAATRRHLPLLQEINMQRFQEGGPVGFAANPNDIPSRERYITADRSFQNAHLALSPFIATQTVLDRYNRTNLTNLPALPLATVIARMLNMSEADISADNNFIRPYFIPDANILAIRRQFINDVGLEQRDRYQVFNQGNIPTNIDELYRILRPNYFASQNPQQQNITPLEQFERFIRDTFQNDIANNAAFFLAGRFGNNPPGQYERFRRLFSLPNDNDLLTSRLYLPPYGPTRTYNNIASVVQAARTPRMSDVQMLDNQGNPIVNIGLNPLGMIESGITTAINRNSARNLEQQNINNMLRGNINNLLDLVTNFDEFGINDNLRQQYPNLNDEQLRSLILQTRRRYNLQGMNYQQRNLLALTIRLGLEQDSTLNNRFLDPNTMALARQTVEGSRSDATPFELLALMRRRLGLELRQEDSQSIEDINRRSLESIFDVILGPPDLDSRTVGSNPIAFLPPNIANRLRPQNVDINPQMVRDMDAARRTYSARRQYGLTGLDRDRLELAVDTARDYNRPNLLPLIGSLLRDNPEITRVSQVRDLIEQIERRNEEIAHQVNAVLINASQTRDFANQGRFARSRNTLFGTSAFAGISGLINQSLNDRFNARNERNDLRFPARPDGEYATGGLIPGVGNKDTHLALTTPGEFIVNKSAVQKIGVPTLHAINQGEIPRFQAGGLVGAIRGNSNQSTPQPQIDLSGSISLFNQSVNVFQTATERLSQALSSIPESIELNGNHRVEVIINGAEVLQQLGSNLEEFIIKRVDDALTNFIKDKNPDIGLV